MRGSVLIVLMSLALTALAPGLALAANDRDVASRAFSPFESLPPMPSSNAAPWSTPPIPSPRDAPFGANVRASEVDTPGNQNEITMAVASDGRIHMGWNDYRSPNPDYRCGYAYSTDGGQTWSPNVLLHLDPWDADGDPFLMVDSSDTVYFVCMPFSRSGGGSRVVVYRSTDGGVTFDPPVSASDTTNGFNDKPWGHVVGTTLHVCYANFVGGGTELRYTSSVDGGQTWAPTRILDRNGNGCVFASTASGRLHLAWVRGGGIYDLTSGNGGATWSSPRFVGSAPFTGAGDQRAGPLPAIAADRGGEDVYIVWTADDGFGTWDVRFSSSSDDGVTWSAAVSPSEVTTGRQFMPGIDVDAAGLVHVSWYDTRTGLVAYRHAASSDGGATWLPSERVTDTEWPTQYFIGDYTTLVADAFGFVNCAWADARSGEVEAYFARASMPFPPRLTRIDLTPPEAWTDADTAVAFTATGYDQFGSVFPTSPSWTATGGTIASGTYTPQRSGDWRVWANESGVSGSAAVHVTPGALARIQISPPSATLTADETIQFTATGYDAKDNVVAISPMWAVTNGDVAGGLFTPEGAGTWTVFANVSLISGSAPVTVLPGALAAIEVTPAVALITADDVLDYNAIGRDAKGNPITVFPVWSAGGGAIDAQGTYAAQVAGAWNVRADAGGLWDQAQVTVTPGALARIDVTPALAAMTADETLDFEATGQDADGNAVAFAPAWSAGGGVIDLQGRYAAQLVGLWSIRAEASGVYGEALVTVTPGALSRIEVSPQTAVITADDSVQYAAQGLDADGNAVAIVPAWSADAGFVSSSGLYDPAPVGTYVVRATVGVISGQATVVVFPGALYRIDVDPPVATVTADETLSLVATAYDAKGNRLGATFLWEAMCGSVTQEGTFEPSLAGVCIVTASVSVVSGSATITVTPGLLSRIDVAPATITVTADETAAFSARGYDAKGNEVPVTPLWRADEGAVDSSGLYRPMRTGTWAVYAEAGLVVGAAQVTVVPGAVARIVVNPAAVTLRSDESVTFAAAGFDRAGNAVVLSGVAWSATNGTVGEGRFEPWRTGTQQIIAAVGTKQGTAFADVRPGPVASVTLSPDRAVVTQEEHMMFIAHAYDAKGNRVDDATLAWRVEGGIGTIDAGGRFRATAGGVGRVVVVASGGGGVSSALSRVDVPSSTLYVWLALVAVLLIPPILIWLVRRRRRRTAS